MRYSLFVSILVFALISTSYSQGAPTFSTCIGDIGNCDKTTTSINFGPTGINEGSFVPVLFTNTGTAPLTINYSFSNPAFAFGLQQTLPPNPLTVQPGASVQTFIVFNPTTNGTQTGQFVSNDNAPGAPHTISLSGTGVSVAAGDFTVMLDPAGPSSFGLRAGGTTSFPVYVVNNTQNPSAAGAAQCSGGPAGSNCSVQPNTFAGFVPQQKLIVSVQVPAKSGSLRHTPVFWEAMIGVSAVVLLRRRRSQRLFLITVLFVGASLISCGGGSSSTSAPIVVTAAINGAPHSLTVPVTVQ